RCSSNAVQQYDEHNLNTRPPDHRNGQNGHICCHFDQTLILSSTFYRCYPMRCDTTTRNGSPRAPDSEAIGVPGLVEPDGSAGKLPPRTRDRERSPIEPEFLAA